MKLLFDNPRGIFDINALTKIPVFNDEFTCWVISSFIYSPKKYKIDLEIF